MRLEEVKQNYLDKLTYTRSVPLQNGMLNDHVTTQHLLPHTLQLATQDDACFHSLLLRLICEEGRLIVVKVLERCYGPHQLHRADK